MSVAANDRSAIRFSRRFARQRAGAAQLAGPRPGETHVAVIPWRFTRRLNTSGRLDLCRAASSGDLGPGVYVVKRPRVMGDELARALLLREAAVGKEVSNANLASVLALGIENGVAQTVLPYCEGVSLDRAMPVWHRSRPAVHFVLSIGRQMASALAALHAAGWLHGQVLLRHAVLSPQGHVTLIDLTGCRRLESQECDTAWPTPVVSPATPELFAARQRLTAAADVYALGSLLFEMLTGREVFEASSAKQLARCHLRQRPGDLRATRVEVSSEVNELVSRMLAKEPLRRPSMEDVVQWLAELEIEELAAG